MSDFLEPILNQIERVDARSKRAPTLVWGEVSQVSPLRVRFDGADSDGEVSALVNGLSLWDRVLCVVASNKVTVLGRAQGFTDLVVPGDLTVNGGTVLDGRTVMPGNSFASKALLDAWQPSDGASAFVSSDGRHYVRVDGVWRAIQARHVADNASNGRAYFGTGDDALGAGQSYMAAIPESDATTEGAFWFYSGADQLFRLYKDVSARFYGDLRIDGDARVYGDLIVDGSITQAGDTNWANLSIPGGSGTFRWRRHHGRIYVEFNVTLNTAVGAGVETSLSGVIPSGIRPSLALGVTISGDGNRPMTGTINTAGNFWFRNNHTAAVTSFSGRADWFA